MRTKLRKLRLTKESGTQHKKQMGSIFILTSGRKFQNGTRGSESKTYYIIVIKCESENMNYKNDGKKKEKKNVFIFIFTSIS